MTIFIPLNEPDHKLPKTSEEFPWQVVEGAKTLITLHEIQELHAKVAPCIFTQNVHTALKILVSAPGFEFNTYEHQDSKIFECLPVSDVLPAGPEHALDQFVLNTTKIDESSYSGNEQILEELSCQLGLNTDEKEKTGQNWIIIWFRDQLTTSRLCGLKTICLMDKDPYEQLGWMEPIFRWFHLQMAFAASLHKQYYGMKAGFGFSHAFKLLGKKGLVSAKVKGNWFHNFEEALKEITTAHFLCAWLEATGASSIKDLCSKPPEELKQLAEHIVLQFTLMAALKAQSQQPPSKSDGL